jgi:hypothetical protein
LLKQEKLQLATASFRDQCWRSSSRDLDYLDDLDDFDDFDKDGGEQVKSSEQVELLDRNIRNL